MEKYWLLEYLIDIDKMPDFLEKILSLDPAEKGIDSRGPYAEYTLNGKEYRLVYGNNGFIVTFYPLEKQR